MAQKEQGSVLDILGLIPQFGGLIWTIVAFVVALSVIVAVHEYGHYIVGRWSGIHAEVFSAWASARSCGAAWTNAAPAGRSRRCRSAAM